MISSSLLREESLVVIRANASLKNKDAWKWNERFPATIEYRSNISNIDINNSNGSSQWKLPWRVKTTISLWMAAKSVGKIESGTLETRLRNSIGYFNPRTLLWFARYVITDLSPPFLSCFDVVVVLALNFHVVSLYSSARLAPFLRSEIGIRNHWGTRDSTTSDFFRR